MSSMSSTIVFTVFKAYSISFCLFSIHFPAIKTAASSFTWATPHGRILQLPLLSTYVPSLSEKFSWAFLQEPGLRLRRFPSLHTRCLLSRTRLSRTRSSSSLAFSACHACSAVILNLALDWGSEGLPVGDDLDEGVAVARGGSRSRRVLLFL